MANVRLTERRIRDANVDAARTTFLWDVQIPGFGIRVSVGGTKSYVLWTRAGAKKRLVTLGRVDKIALDSARRSAAAELDQIENGGDDLLARRAKRQDGKTVSQGARWFVETYIPRRQGLGKMTERTGIEYRRQLHAYVLPAIGHMRIAEVTRQDIEKLLDDRIGWNKASLYTRVRALVRSMFNTFIVEGWRDEASNPGTRITTPTEKERTRTLSPNEQSALHVALARMGDHPAVALILFLDATGCRLNEARTLRWDFVDFETSTIILPKTKTGRKAIRATDEAMTIVSESPRLADNEYVFHGMTRGAPLAEHTIRGIFHRAAKLAGVAGIKPHDLRRSYITDALAAGVALTTVADLVGHATVHMTARYAQANDFQVREGGEILAAARKKRRGAEILAPEFGERRA